MSQKIFYFDNFKVRHLLRKELRPVTTTSFALFVTKTYIIKVPKGVIECFLVVLKYLIGSTFVKLLYTNNNSFSFNALLSGEGNYYNENNFHPFIPLRDYPQGIRIKSSLKI